MPYTTTASSSGVSLTLTRTLRAPRSLVFAAFTDANHLGSWWGGLTGSFARVEPHVGGRWEVTMSADGLTWPMLGVIRELVPDTRLVIALDLSGHPASWHAELVRLGATVTSHVVCTVELADATDGTLLKLTQTFADEATCRAFQRIGAAEGAEHGFARLDDLLDDLPTLPDELLTTRTYGGAGPPHLPARRGRG